jgi:hypothetical protein
MGQSDEHNRFFKENVAADSSTSFLLSRLSWSPKAVPSEHIFNIRTALAPAWASFRRTRLVVKNIWPWVGTAPLFDVRTVD